MTPTRLASLPVWAQNHIRDVESERTNLQERIRIMKGEEYAPETRGPFSVVQLGDALSGERVYLPKYSHVELDLEQNPKNQHPYGRRVSFARNLQEPWRAKVSVDGTLLVIPRATNSVELEIARL